MKKSAPKLPRGYELRELARDEFLPLWKKAVSDVFEKETCWLDLESALTKEERGARDRLKARLSSRYELHFGIFHSGKMVAWSTGWQTSAYDYFMVNSGVYPKHRRKGLYSLLLDAVVERVGREGFQLIWSIHATTNNAILIPKLTKGFLIAGVEVWETYGVDVKLVYHFNRIREETMHFRSGLRAPSRRLKGLIRGLSSRR